MRKGGVTGQNLHLLINTQAQVRSTALLQDVCPNLGRKTVGFQPSNSNRLASLTQCLPESNEKFELIRFLGTSKDLETSFPKDRGEPLFSDISFSDHWVPAPTLPGSQLFRSVQKLQQKVTSPAF